MKLDEFLKKWDNSDPAFQEDLFQMLTERQTDSTMQDAAIRLLTSIRGKKLSIYNKNNDGFVSFGESLANSVIVSYPLSVGIQESDWFVLLQESIKSNFNQ
jgi:hypothetical protein